MINELITVAIALYNNEEHVLRCVKSVIQQTYSNLEILIVNDGSTDNSVKLLNENLSDERLRIISKKNSGLSDTRQNALNEAKGKFICFIDADDFLELSYIEKLHSTIVETNADICICSTRFIMQDGSEDIRNTNKFKMDECDTVVSISKNKLEFDYQNLATKYLMSDIWNKMYRTQFIRKTGVKFELKKGYNGSDLFFNYKLLLHFPNIITIEGKEYVHVIYESSAVHRKNKNLQGSAEELYIQLTNECDKVGLEKVTRNHLPTIYYSFLRIAALDLCEENEWNYKKSREALIQYRKKNLLFLKQHNVICRVSVSIFLTIYVKLLNQHFIFPLYLYLRIWSRKNA